MANGIDAVYDPSDVRRMLAELEQQRLQTEADRRRKTQGATKAVGTAWDMWSKEQAVQAKELIASGEGKDYMWDPEMNWLKKLYTPSGGQVVPTKEALAKGKDFKDIRGPKTIPKSISETVSESGLARDINPNVGPVETASGTTLGKVVTGVGTALSAYDLATNWEKKSDVDKGLGLAKTGFGIASLLNPAYGIYALGAGLADLIWD